jgi:hypothetical protein
MQWQAVSGSGNILNMNFSVEFNMYKGMVTSYWYLLRSSHCNRGPGFRKSAGMMSMENRPRVMVVGLSMEIGVGIGVAEDDMTVESDSKMADDCAADIRIQIVRCLWNRVGNWRIS